MIVMNDIEHEISQVIVYDVTWTKFVFLSMRIELIEFNKKMRKLII
jgi:hypothetical protein